MQAPSVGLVALSVYHPGCIIHSSLVSSLVEQLGGTMLPSEYSKHIETTFTMPGSERRFPVELGSVNDQRISGQDAEVLAACLLLASASTPKSDIDLVIGSKLSGSTIHDRMNLQLPAGVTATSSFLYDLFTATNLVSSKRYRRIIITASYCSNRDALNTTDCAVAAMVTDVEPDYGMVGWATEKSRSDSSTSPRSSTLAPTGCHLPLVSDSPLFTSISPRSSSPSGELLEEDQPLQHFLLPADCILLITKLYKETNMSGETIGWMVADDSVATTFFKGSSIFPVNIYEPSVELYRGCCSLPANIYSAIGGGLIKPGESLLLLAHPPSSTSGGLDAMIVKPSFWLFHNVYSQQT
ncbi:hypothetical protein Pelo_8576 [Pelomyxa schiedti]|nr:hypothetical protein Pelo_8576 [Pelomyxa schiedti]